MGSRRPPNSLFQSNLEDFEVELWTVELVNDVFSRGAVFRRVLLVDVIKLVAALRGCSNVTERHDRIGRNVLRPTTHLEYPSSLLSVYEANVII